MLHVMPFMGPDLEINSILFYRELFSEDNQITYIYIVHEQIEGIFHTLKYTQLFFSPPH